MKPLENFLVSSLLYSIQVMIPSSKVDIVSSTNLLAHRYLTNLWIRNIESNKSFKKENVITFSPSLKLNLI